MTIRIAKGSELPNGWRPGLPLPVGRQSRPSTTRECPFGLQCYSCRKGLRWDARRAKHTVKRSRALKRRRRRAA